MDCGIRCLAGRARRGTHWILGLALLSRGQRVIPAERCEGGGPEFPEENLLGRRSKYLWTDRSQQARSEWRGGGRITSPVSTDNRRLVIQRPRLLAFSSTFRRNRHIVPNWSVENGGVGSAEPVDGNSKQRGNQGKCLHQQAPTSLA